MASRRVRGLLSPASPKAFTDDQVREIRERREDGATIADLAAEYGVSVSTIYNVCARRTYGWVR
jgi:Mor family transcriptional regulator